MAATPDVTAPWWLDRQRTLGGPHDEVDVTHRNWTLLGILASPQRATVDPRGMVTPRPGGWSLDWWVRAGERWYLPGREAAVRQRLRDGTPVVETILAVPDGTIIQRAFAVRSSDGGSHVVVEVENRSLAAALALVVRPWNATGRASVTDIAVDGSEVRVDGAVGLLLERPPMATHVADGDSTTLADTLVAAADLDAVRLASAGRASVHSRSGRAEAAVIVGLPHTTTFRALMPMGDPSELAEVPVLPDPVPSAEQVVSGWASQTVRGPRIRFPDSRLASLWEAQRRHLLVAHTGDGIASVSDRAFDRPFDPVSAVGVLEALQVAGFGDEAAMVLDTWRDRQHEDGHVGDDEGRADADGAAVVALADHWRRGGDARTVADQMEAVAAAAHWIERRRRRRFGRRGAPAGLVPPSDQPGWLGGSDATGSWRGAVAAHRDSWWSLAGLRGAAELLDAHGEADAARVAAEGAEDLSARIDQTLPASGVVPVGPGCEVDDRVVAVVDAVLVGGVSPREPWVDATVDEARKRLVRHDGALRRPGQDGADPYLTARFGRLELARGEESALARVRWLLDNSTPTWTFPELVHPHTSCGALGAGHHVPAGAEALLLVRDLLVRSTEDGIVVMPVLPPEWHARRWEVHDLPTPHGNFGFAVRWHGDGRPALLWQLEPVVPSEEQAAAPDAPPEGRHPARRRVGQVTITAPGLDPSWSSTEGAGEVLLEPMPAPDPGSFERPDDTSDTGVLRPTATPAGGLVRFPDEAPPAGATVTVAAPTIRRRKRNED